MGRNPVRWNAGAAAEQDDGKRRTGGKVLVRDPADVLLNRWTVEVDDVLLEEIPEPRRRQVALDCEQRSARADESRGRLRQPDEGDVGARAGRERRVVDAR